MTPERPTTRRSSTKVSPCPGISSRTWSTACATSPQALEEMLRHFEYVEARDSARHNSVMHLVQRMLPHLNLEDDDDD